MKSKTTRQFRKLLVALPADVRKQAYVSYRLFRRDMHHTSLHFKKVSQKREIYSVRIGISYRALGLIEEGNVIVWFWIGSHAEYDKLL